MSPSIFLAVDKQDLGRCRAGVRVLRDAEPLGPGPAEEWGAGLLVLDVRTG